MLPDRIRSRNTCAIWWYRGTRLFITGDGLSCDGVLELWWPLNAVVELRDGIPAGTIGSYGNREHCNRPSWPGQWGGYSAASLWDSDVRPWSLAAADPESMDCAASATPSLKSR